MLYANPKGAELVYKAVA